jgi:hypothetical protein
MHWRIEQYRSRKYDRGGRLGFGANSESQFERVLRKATTTLLHFKILPDDVAWWISIAIKGALRTREFPALTCSSFSSGQVSQRMKRPVANPIAPSPDTLLKERSCLSDQRPLQMPSQKCSASIASAVALSIAAETLLQRLYKKLSSQEATRQRFKLELLEAKSRLLIVRDL